MGFRNFNEAKTCYQKFHCNVFVSEEVKKSFCDQVSVCHPLVLYNTVDSKKILEAAGGAVEPSMPNDKYKLVAVGKLEPVKGYERLLRIHERLLKQDHLPLHTYFLGEGTERACLQDWVKNNGMQDSVTFLGYQTNPYKYVAPCDLFVCSSYSEGFSTAATEALIVGTPVVTTKVSGMQEMLGDNEYGVITENDEEALYQGIRDLLKDPQRLSHYREKARERGLFFGVEQTVQAVEEMLINIEDEES